MSRWLMAVAVGLTLAGAGLAEEDEGRLTGKVTDEAGQALVGANVAVKGPQIPGGKGVSTDGQGSYQIGDLHPGTYQVTATYVGHKAAAQEVYVAAGQALKLDLVLNSTSIVLEQSLVSASRVQEKILDAPASVAVVEAPEIRNQPVLSVSEHIKNVPGVDFARTGLVQSSAVVRGFNNVFSGALMTLTDNRLAHVPSLRLNAYNFIPVVNDDIERIEVVLGPGSALYGPNSANGVMHILTRSPLDAQGTSVRLGGGERSLRQVEFRSAGLVTPRLGYKLSAQYYAGTDWKYQDPVENQARAVNPSLKARDFDLQRRGGELRLDYRPGERFSAIAALGHNQGDFIEMTGLGAAQAKDWAYNYAQMRLLYGNWFAQAFRNWSDAGKTFLLRDGAGIVDKSSLTAFQVQHLAALGGRQRFIYGFDALLTRPDTEGTITGQNEGDDNINELGGYLQSETALHSKVDLVLALRYDDHNRIDKAEWSPRAALVFKPRETQILRLTYNRAFSTPTTNNLFLDRRSSTDPFGLKRLGLPSGIDIVAQGTYREGFDGGFTFGRNESGKLYFSSPFMPTAGRSLVLDDPSIAGAMWGLGRQAVLAQFTPQFQALVTQQLVLAGVAQAAAQAQAQALAAGLPNLLPAQLSGLKHSLMELNLGKVASGAANPFDVVSGVNDVPLTKPTITRTYELGYKGLIGGRLVVAADAYRTQTKNFVGPLAVETPNVFLDPASLAQALGPALAAALQDPANAALAQALGGLDSQLLGGNGNGTPLDELTTQVVGGVARIPFGTVSPLQAYDPNAVILTYRNYGLVTVKGMDLSLTYYLGDVWSFSGNFSWVDKNLFKNLDNIADVALNSPKQKLRLGVIRELPQWRLRAGAGVRHNGSYPMASGVYEGKVKSYTLVDLNLVYRLPVERDLSLIVNADNLLDKQHQEFIGAPQIGRLVFAQLGVNF
ncbi:MAG: TonB-dependent receptor [Candidatus Handelsmanbacteria bacterium]|nr:TonB-dependent receptor [Candidatus Handelsmanbacteria bacterium]